MLHEEKIMGPGAITVIAILLNIEFKSIYPRTHPRLEALDELHGCAARSLARCCKLVDRE